MKSDKRIAMGIEVPFIISIISVSFYG